MRRLLNLWLRLTEKPLLARAEPARLRRSFETKARLFFRAPRGSEFRARTLSDAGQVVPALDVSTGGAGGGALILYFHGGGYVFGSPRTHRAMLARVSKHSGLSATLPEYRLAPEHPFPAAVEDALTAYRAVMDHPGGVVLGGDSAGGGLALALLAEIIRLDLARPKGCFAFSPLADLRFSGASMTANAQADVVLPAERATEMAQRYLAGADPDDPRATPLLADFAGAPPIWLVAGDTEILLDDTRRMADLLGQQGVNVTWEIAHDLPHVWPIFAPLLPEADKTLRQLAEWLKAL